MDLISIRRMKWRFRKSINRACIPHDLYINFYSVFNPKSIRRLLGGILGAVESIPSFEGEEIQDQAPIRFLYFFYHFLSSFLVVTC